MAHYIAQIVESSNEAGKWKWISDAPPQSNPPKFQPGDSLMLSLGEGTGAHTLKFSRLLGTKGWPFINQHSATLEYISQQPLVFRDHGDETLSWKFLIRQGDIVIDPELQVGPGHGHGHGKS
jgi:hypothetical protein